MKTEAELQAELDKTIVGLQEIPVPILSELIDVANQFAVREPGARWVCIKVIKAMTLSWALGVDIDSTPRFLADTVFPDSEVS